MRKPMVKISLIKKNLPNPKTESHGSNEKMIMIVVRHKEAF